MGYLTDASIQQLKKYKYVSGGYTYFDNIMYNFWNLCVRFLPMWMAPNLVTLIGFFFMLSCEAVCLMYDVNFKNDIPSWVMYWLAAGTFVYQTMDAIDG